MSRDGLGKVSREFLKRFVLTNTGAASAEMLVGPGLGLDNAVLSIGGGRVMVITSDPLSIIPALGMEASAWLTIHGLASDLTTSAVRPRYAVLNFNLPAQLDMSDFASYVRALSRECKELGISIVGGHTGKYPGCDFTIAGAGVLMGFAEDGRYLTPAMARVGDRVLITKGAAIEATAVLSRVFPKKIKEEFGKRVQRDSASYLGLCSTVKDALSASRVGLKEDGVSSMHDATEGGVLGGLYELSLASGKRILVDKRRIFISEETRKVCSLFQIDPLLSLSEGTLIVTCSSTSTDSVRSTLKKDGIESYEVGEVKDGSSPGLWMASEGSRPKRYVPPQHDRYWSAYSRAIARGWK